jgi:acetylglutamate kinase
MKEFIDKAKILIEAFPYIQKFQGKIVVIKFGGSALEEDISKFHAVATDIAFMSCAGMRPVVVHGGGKAISKRMKEAGIEPKFVKGLRVTCDKSIKIVERVLNREINPDIVHALQQAGGSAIGISGYDVILAKKKTQVDPATGEVIDLGFVGEPVKICLSKIIRLINKGMIPVISPLGKDRKGVLYNINADITAAFLAKNLKARKLVFMSDVPGILRDRKDMSSVISTIRIKEVTALIKSGIIDAGMLPKVLSGVDALSNGVEKVHIVNADMPHSLLLEIFTDKGIGTEIIK